MDYNWGRCIYLVISQISMSVTLALKVVARMQIVPILMEATLAPAYLDSPEMELSVSVGMGWY